MSDANIDKTENVARILESGLDVVQGLLRLTPIWVLRSFSHLASESNCARSAFATLAPIPLIAGQTLATTKRKLTNEPKQKLRRTNLRNQL